LTPYELRRPRVLFAIGSLATGGSENQLVELLTRIHGRDVDAAVLTWDSTVASTHRKRLGEAGVPLLTLAPLPSRQTLETITVLTRLVALFRRLGFDVAYPWLEHTSFYVAPISRAHGVPVVVARRNVSGAAIETWRIPRYLIRRSERLATVVTGNSKAVVDTAVARGIDPAKLRLVRNGHVILPPLPAPPADIVVLGYVARFRPEKGHRRLVEALAKVQAKTPWRVDLAGEGAAESGLQDEVRRLGLEERVRFLGPVLDVRAFWEDRSAALLLSDHEGSPNSLIEAAFAGRPLIGTDVGGIPEIVAPSGGLLVPPDDPAAIASAIDRLIDDRQLQARLGAAAHRQAKERFGMEAFVEGHLSAIAEARERARPRHRRR